MEQVKLGYKKTEVGVIPEDWDSVQLGTLIELVSGQHILAKNYNNSEIGIPFKKLTSSPNIYGKVENYTKL